MRHNEVVFCMQRTSIVFEFLAICFGSLTYLSSTICDAADRDDTGLGHNRESRLEDLLHIPSSHVQAGLI